MVTWPSFFSFSIALSTLFFALWRDCMTVFGKLFFSWWSIRLRSSSRSWHISFDWKAPTILGCKSSASRYCTVSSSPEKVRSKSSTNEFARRVSDMLSQSQKMDILSLFSSKAVREKLQLPSKATMLVASAKYPHLKWEIPVPPLGAIILISIRPCLISHDRHSKKCMPLSSRTSFIPSRLFKSSAGIDRLVDSPFLIASLSSTDNMSLMTIRILPPL